MKPSEIRRTTEFTLDGFVYEDTEYLPTYQQPKLKSGDLVRVTEKLAENAGVGGCEKSNATDYIGKKFMLKTYYDFPDNIKLWGFGDGRLIPEDCLELITNKEEYER